MVQRIWKEDDTRGHWEVEPTAAAPQMFEVNIEFRPLQQPGTVFLAIGDHCWSQPVAAGAQECRFTDRRIHAGRQRVQGRVTDGDDLLGARYVIFRRDKTQA